MKKSILAIAVGAALAAGSAQAAVEVYGKLHLSFDQLDNGNTYNGNTNNAAAAAGSAASSGGAANAGTKAKSLYVSSNSSMVGFKASEDLEGGMKAIAVLEFMVESDNPVTTVPFTEREVYAGLGGDFGTVRIGKIDTPTKLLGRKADFFGDQIGDSRNLTSRASGLGLVLNAPLHNVTPYPAYTYTSATTAQNQRPNWETRSTNALAYTSPTMGGVTVAVLYQPDEGRSDSSIKDISATLAGDAGPGKLVAGLSWTSHGKAWNSDEKAESAIRFAGSYAISDVKVALFYQKASDMNAVPATPAVGSTAAVAEASLDRTTWGLGGSYKIGAGAVKAQYYKAGESKGAAADPADGATMIALGYDHNLSKNTKVYFAYAQTKNDDNGTLGTSGSGNNIPTKGGTYTVSAAGHGSNNVMAGQNVNTINNGSDPKAVSVGMIFSF
ncbi:MAG: porin [Gammaproteobacteria bacterium]|nr:porin [Gammaproteobacteria bacterium]